MDNQNDNTSNKDNVRLEPNEKIKQDKLADLENKFIDTYEKWDIKFTYMETSHIKFMDQFYHHQDLQISIIPGLPALIIEDIEEEILNRDAGVAEIRAQQRQDLSISSKNFKLSVQISEIKMNTSRNIDDIILQHSTSMDQGLQDSSQKLESLHKQNGDIYQDLIKITEELEIIDSQILAINKPSNEKNEGQEDSKGNVEKSSSLIDDFADPNLEQPSHTDPED